jgi:hypothetical protein
MNPHQVDAALFALGSPLSKGALLAEIGGTSPNSFHILNITLNRVGSGL